MLITQVLGSNHNTSVQIDDASLQDAADIAVIHYQSWRHAYQNLLPQAYIGANNNLQQKSAMWQEILPNPKVTTLIAKDEAQRSLGFISYCQTKAGVEITTIYVLPDIQSSGVGSALIAAALDRITQTKQESHPASKPPVKVALWVLQSNQSAINFYLKRGFRSTGEQEIEVFEDSEIVDIEMALTLN